MSQISYKRLWRRSNLGWFIEYIKIDIILFNNWRQFCLKTVLRIAIACNGPIQISYGK